jgi:hypothetical protein
VIPVAKDAGNQDGYENDHRDARNGQSKSTVSPSVLEPTHHACHPPNPSYQVLQLPLPEAGAFSFHLLLRHRDNDVLFGSLGAVDGLHPIINCSDIYYFRSCPLSRRQRRPTGRNPFEGGHQFRSGTVARSGGPVQVRRSKIIARQLHKTIT